MEGAFQFILIRTLLMLGSDPLPSYQGQVKILKMTEASFKMDRSFPPNLNKNRSFVTLRFSILLILRKDLTVAEMRLYVYVHAPGQFEEKDSVTKTFTTIGIKNYVDLTYNVNIDRLGALSKTPCTEKHNFDFDDCLYQKQEAELLNKFNCTVPYLPPNYSVATCLGKDKTYNKALLDLYNLVKSEQRKHCGLPCLQMPGMFGTLLNDDNRANYKNYYQHRSYIRIYLKSMVRVQEATWDYPTITMLAEFAGYAGIIFGISVLHLTTFTHKVAQLMSYII